MKRGIRTIVGGHAARLGALIAVAIAWPAMADTTRYTFSGLYNIAGGTQRYTGEFSITDPLQTSVRPALAADVTLPSMAAVWAGTSNFYTGGAGLSIRFASGTLISASSIDIVVDNTTFSGSGAPYPLGLSVQLYPSAITIVAPTTPVCATPTGECGPDDDPLYQDATQAAIMATTGVYFAFYSAPLSTVPGVPNLVTAFPLGQGGLGVFSVQHGLNNTTLTSFDGFSAVVTPTSAPVPEASTGWLMAVGLAGIVLLRGRRRLGGAADRFAATAARPPGRVRAARRAAVRTA